jgi:hypothetical protein
MWMDAVFSMKMEDRQTPHPAPSPITLRPLNKRVSPDLAAKRLLGNPRNSMNAAIH